MRSPVSLSSLFALGVCLSATALSGCDLPKGDGKDFQRMAARLAEIDVEGKGDASSSSESSESSASAEPTHKDQIELAFETAKELTTGKDGLMAHVPPKLAPKELIRIVNPLDMDRPDAETPLETGVNTAPTVTLAEAPPVIDAPVAKPQIPTPVERPAAQKASAKASVTIEAPAFRTIQIGSFSSRAVADAAWSGLQARYPGLERFKPVLEPVTTAQGKTMVRLKVGPVNSPEQAQRLCAQLDISDAWCVKAG